MKSNLNEFNSEVKNTARDPFNKSLTIDVKNLNYLI